jgi:hypothetical protein
LLGACVQPSQRYEYSGPSHANRWHIPRSTPLDSTAPFQASREADRNGELPGPMRLGVAAWLHRKHAYSSGGRHVAADEEL